MILHDISATIEPEMAVYKNRKEKKPELTVTRDYSIGSVYETRLAMDLHTGTHIDMPLHILPNGSNSDQWDIKNCFTRCSVLDFSTLNSDRITASDLENKDELQQAADSIFSPGKTILLKTKNSFESAFNYAFVYLAESGAHYLVSKKIRGVGIDALGIERDQPGHPTHHALLGAGIFIIEGLYLEAVCEGDYILALMPLKIGAAEAMPARALLLHPDSMLPSV